MTAGTNKSIIGRPLLVSSTLLTYYSSTARSLGPRVLRVIFLKSPFQNHSNDSLPQSLTGQQVLEHGASVLSSARHLCEKIQRQTCSLTEHSSPLHFARTQSKHPERSCTDRAAIAHPPFHSRYNRHVDFFPTCCRNLLLWK